MHFSWKGKKKHLLKPKILHLNSSRDCGAARRRCWGVISWLIIIEETHSSASASSCLKLKPYFRQELWKLLYFHCGGMETSPCSDALLVGVACADGEIWTHTPLSCKCSSSKIENLLLCQDWASGITRAQLFSGKMHQKFEDQRFH